MNRTNYKLRTVFLCILALAFIAIPNYSVINDSSIQEAPPKSSVINPITIYSPQATTYTAPSAGYYPAVHGFENISNGQEPQNWKIETFGDDAYVKVFSGINGHNKVLRLWDPWELGVLYPYAKAYTSIESNRGTIEFWVMATTQDLCKIGLRDVENEVKFGLKMSGGLWSTYNGEGIPGLNEFAIPNSWYHVQINFETTTSKYRNLGKYEWTVIINDDQSTPMSFQSEGPIDNLCFSTDLGPWGYSIYVDAVGFSWDPYYDINDNKYEGLLVDFDPDNLQLMRMQLDGSPFRKIYGDTVITMPKSGQHTIRICGEDNGEFYESPLRTFTVNIADKIGVFFYASDAGNEDQSFWLSELVEFYTRHYADILTSSESYNKIYIYRDIRWDTEFDEIMDCLANKRVDSSDELFVWMRGHGKYDQKHSYVYLCPAESDYIYYRVKDDHVFNKMDEIYTASNSIKLGVFIQACESGNFALNTFKGKYPFLCITSAARKNDHSEGLGGNSYFSGAFFDSVNFGYDAEDAFELAKDNLFVTSNPQFTLNNSDFMFFD